MDTAPPTTKPSGNLFIATLLCGLCGGVLAVVLSLVGLFSELRVRFSSWLEEAQLLTQPAHDLGEPLEWGLALIVAVLVSLFVLDSAALWRRLLIGACAVVLILSTVFSASLFGFYFFPLVALLAVLIAFVFALIYTSQHEMRCDEIVLFEEIAEAVELDVKDAPKKPKKKEEIEISTKKSDSNVPLPRIKKVNAQAVKKQKLENE